MKRTAGAWKLLGRLGPWDFLLALALPALAALFGAAWYIPHTRDEALADRHRELLDHVTAISESLGRFSEDALGDVATIASFPSVEALLAVATPPPRHGAGSADHLAVVLDRLRDLQGITRIFLIGSAGELRLASPASAELEPGCREDVRSAMAAGGRFSGLHREGPGETVFSFAIPGSPSVDRPQGWVLAEIDVRSWLMPLLNQRSWPYRSSEILFTRDPSDSVQYLSLSPGGASVGLVARRPLRDVRGISTLAAFAEGRSEVMDDNGAQVLVAASRLTPLPWQVALKVDRGEVLRHPIRVAWLAVLSWAAVTMVFSMTATSLIARRRRSRALVLAARQERLTRLLDKTHDAILVLDVGGTILRPNLRAVELYGEPTERLVGRDFVRDLFPGGEIAAGRTQMEAVVERGSVLFETLHRGRDGEIFPVEVSARMVEESAERYIVCVVRDITARRRMEEVSRAAMDALRAVVDSSPMPIWTLTRDGLVLFWNPAATRVFGWEAEEVLNRPCPVIREEDREEFLELIHRAWGGESLANVPVTRRRRDGQDLPMLVSMAALRAGNAEVTGVIATLVDVTDLDRVERMARETQEKLDAFFRASAIGMLFADVHGVVYQANDEFLRIVGHSCADLEAGRVRWDDITPPEYLGIDAEAFAEAKLRGVCAPYEKEYLRKDGTRIWVQIGFALLGEEREGSVAYIIDIGRRKRAEQELRLLNQELERRVDKRTAELAAANSELEAFSYSVSHDLRAPLRAIAGFSRILIDEHQQALGEEGRRLLKVVTENARGMGRLIDDLLAFSRAGRHELERHRVDMSMLAESVFQELCPPQERASVDLRLDQLPEAWADAALMRQVWINLIGNALKFSAPRARRVIGVEGRTEGDGTVYTVRDNGVGFDMKHAEKLFGVFQRLHPQNEFEGTGVGLALVQRIVRRHGGRIWAEGVPDGGATFSFLLPNGAESA